MRRGKQNKINYAGKCLSILIVLCMAVSGLMGLFVANVGTASQTGPETLDIPEIISGVHITYESKPGDMSICDHDGSLTITGGGSLTLINTTLNFLQDGLYDLDVSGASTLKLVNSTITTGATFQATWSPFLDVTIDTNSNLFMDDHSALAFPGTLNIDNSLVYVNDSWITGLGSPKGSVDFPGAIWANKFPTMAPVLDTSTGSYVYGTPADDWDDGPIMTFQNCDNVTIADSCIDKLYENTTYDASAVALIDERFVLDDTEMSVINSYLSLDWQEYNILTYWTKSVANLHTDSHIYAYNMTLNHVYGTIPSSPYLFADTSEVYYYKWAEIPVVNYYDIPLEGADVDPAFVYAGGPATINEAYVATMNDLSSASTPEDISADIRILDYMNRVSEDTISGANYDLTNSDGMVMMPLLTTINPSMPAGDIDGDHCGEYTIEVTHSTATESTYVDFTPFPNIATEDNTIQTLTVEMDSIMLPVPTYGEFDLVVNNTLPLTSIGHVLIDSSHMQNGYVLVEENGVLDITDSTFVMDQLYPNQFNIIVRGNGELNIDNSIIESNNFVINMYVRDNAKVNIIDTTTPTHMNIIADDTSTISIKGSEIGGSFSVPASDANVRLEVINSTFRKALDTFGGTSIGNLTAITMIIPQISVSDDAEINIYRWIEALVEDANHYPIEGVTVYLNYNMNFLYPIPQQSAITDTDGKVIFRTLSDIIRGDLNPDAQPISSYNLTAEFNVTTVETLNVGLPSYDDMTYNDNYIYFTITMDAVRPDLDPPMGSEPAAPGRGEEVTIWANISNTGPVAAHNILVRFSDETQGFTIEDIWIDELAAGAWQIVYTNYTWYEIEDLITHVINVTVDEPYNIIKELSETNNYGSTNVTIIGRPDLRLRTSTDIGTSSPPWVVNYTIDLTVTVYNEGDMPANNVTVHIYDDDIVTDEHSIGNYTIFMIAAGGSFTTPTIPWQPELADTYLLHVVIDMDNTIEEILEDNNAQNKSITITDYADLYINQLEFISDGTSVTEVENRTMVTLRAQVYNTGGTPASGIIVSFYEGQNLINYDTLPTINAGGGYAIAEVTWFATSDLNGNSIDRDIRVSAASGAFENPGGLSNELTETLTIRDLRADLTLVNDDVNILEENVIGFTPFDVNVTVWNNGDNTATNFTIDIYYDLIVPENRLGSLVVAELDGNMNTSADISCAGIEAEGTHYLLVAIDRNVITDDTFEVNGMDYNLTGSVEEFNEANNELVNISFIVTAPQYILTSVSPDDGHNYTIGKENNTWVSGSLTMLDGRVVVGAPITIELGGNTVTTNTDAAGNFGTSITLPANIGQYDITVSAEGVPDDLTTININEETELPWLWIIIIIVIAVAGIIIGITLYLKYVGLGKTVECGECGAFIPEAAARCPKCNTEFETDTAKCSICGAWVPMNSKTCPECNSEFTIGDEEIEDYKVQMKRQYDDVVQSFKKEARKELGANFTEADFQAWWATQATFVTFDQWLKEEEEMKRLGSKPCPNCQTHNSVTATICHKCGTVMEEKKKKAPPKKVRPEPVKEEPAPAPEPEVVAAPAAAPVAAAAAPAPEPAEEKKKCPSCGMETGIHEKTCPICSYDFEKEEKPPEGGDAQPTKKVVKKPVKKVVRRPVKKE